MELAGLTREQQDDSRKLVLAGIALVVVSYLGWWVTQSIHAPLAHAHATGAHDAAPAAHAAAHAVPPAFYSVLPFVALLLSIALLPLFHVTEAWWERNWNRLLVAVGLGSITFLYYAIGYGEGVVDHATHQMSAAGWPAALVMLKNALIVEYIPFITLLFSLYVISGGISIEGNLVGTPRLNTGLIAIGAALASFIGTTGAAMLLIRPLLKANARRQYVAHTVVFFIFVACNTGGCLLPIGDPPLFLGYMRGVHFTWTLSLWPMWLFMNLLLIAVYFVWDTLRFRHEDRDAITAAPARPERLAIRGRVNFLWLLGVIGCVALLSPTKPLPGTHWYPPHYFREIAMLGLTALSLWATSPAVRQKNAFNYDAILEVAALFVGIFICMQAPVQILNTYGGSLGIDTPTKFFWGTGVLSAFLDNAPTYVVFFETAKSLGGEGTSVAGVLVPLLTAIALGSVFMGAMTYIGNGPNFMVKAIAESNNVRMPSFFGYMLYSCAVLLPLCILMNLLFL